jgi:hypothetical protein
MEIIGSDAWEKHSGTFTEGCTSNVGQPENADRKMQTGKCRPENADNVEHELRVLI